MERPAESDSLLTGGSVVPLPSLDISGPFHPSAENRPRAADSRVEAVEKQSSTLYFGFASAVALLLFAWLAVSVLQGQSMRFDLAGRAAVHAWANPGLTSFMRFMSWLGSPYFVAPAAGLAVWRLSSGGRARAGVLFVVAVVGGEALDQILKLAFRRPRPDAFFGLSDPITYGFPSGHAVTAACFYGVLAAILATRTASTVHKALLGMGATLMAALIGLSRVYLGVHYPTDVVAGYAAAAVWVFAVRAGYLAWLCRAQRQASAATPKDVLPSPDC
jgi:undecaprenyl-diphosphatase